MHEIMFKLGMLRSVIIHRDEPAHVVHSRWLDAHAARERARRKIDDQLVGDTCGLAASVRGHTRTSPRGYSTIVASNAFLVYMLSPMLRKRFGRTTSLSSPKSSHPSLIWESGRPMHCPFEVCSAFGLPTRVVTVYRDPLSEGFSHFVTSMTAPVASGWSGCRAGLHPLESTAFSWRTPTARAAKKLRS